MLIVGASYFGRIWMTHHKLADATNYATRAAAIAKNSDSGEIGALIERRLGDTSGCASIRVNATTTEDLLGLTRLQVTARCTLEEAFGSQMFRAVAPNQIEVTVALPFDEPPP